MDGWTDGGLLLGLLTSTFWQAKPRSVPTRSRNWTAASGEEWGRPELHQGLSLQTLRNPKALWVPRPRKEVTKKDRCCKSWTQEVPMNRNESSSSPSLWDEDLRNVKKN